MNHAVAIETLAGELARPLSVLQIGDGWFPEFAGGAQNIFYQLARLLPQQGTALRGLVVGSDLVAAQSDARVQGFAPRTAPLHVRLRGARRAIRDAIRTERPDIIASHFALFAFPALDLIDRRHFVVHFHGPWAAESRIEGAHPLAVRAMHAIERAVYRHASRLIVLSEAFGNILHDSYGIPPERIRLVPGGVECARFAIAQSQIEARREMGWPEQGRIVLSVRRLARRMGLDQLIAAIAFMRESHPDLRLFIAGDGDMEAALRQQVASLGLQDRVILTGRIAFERLPFAYRAADLTIVPSCGLEGFGLVTAESLATGTPVLVTPVGGLPEAVAPLAPELVLQGFTAADLGAGLIAALDGRLTLPDAESCRQYARRRFDWPAIAAQTRAVYCDALA